MKYFILCITLILVSYAASAEKMTIDVYDQSDMKYGHRSALEPTHAVQQLPSLAYQLPKKDRMEIQPIVVGMGYQLPVENDAVALPSIDCSFNLVTGYSSLDGMSAGQSAPQPVRIEGVNTTQQCEKQITKFMRNKQNNCTHEAGPDSERYVVAKQVSIFSDSPALTGMLACNQNPAREVAHLKPQPISPIKEPIYRAEPVRPSPLGIGSAGAN